MAYNGPQVTVTIQASEALTDLNAGSGELYKVIDNTGAAGAAAGNSIGILQYGADDGGNVTLAISGVSKFVAGGAVASGASLQQANSGYLVTASSGGIVVGKNLPAAVGSGSVGTGIFNFATPVTIVNSNGI